MLTCRQTVTAVRVMRNRFAATGIKAVQHVLTGIFRQKRLQTLKARAAYISQLFKSEDENPIIWREYIEGDIQNHPEIGGYKTITIFSTRHHLYP